MGILAAVWVGGISSGRAGRVGGREWSGPSCGRAAAPGGAMPDFRL